MDRVGLGNLADIIARATHAIISSVGWKLRGLDALQEPPLANYFITVPGHNRLLVEDLNPTGARSTGFKARAVKHRLNTVNTSDRNWTTRDYLTGLVHNPSTSTSGLKVGFYILRTKLALCGKPEEDTKSSRRYL